MMCMIDTMPKNNLELHVVKPKPNLLPIAAPKAVKLVRGSSGVRNLRLLLSMSSGKNHCKSFEGEC